MKHTQNRAIDGVNGTWLLVATMLRAMSHGLLRLYPDRGSVMLECRGPSCAKCCRAFNLVHVYQKDLLLPEIRRLKVIEISSVAFIRGDRHGCSEISKGGDCRIYESRPTTCRDYPWYKIAGDIYYDSGCPGMNVDAGVRPSSFQMVDIVETTQHRRTIIVMARLLKFVRILFK